MARYLVTGGAGFIGSNLVDFLRKDGHAVRVLDNFSTGRKENLAHLRDGKDYELFRGDLNDAALVKKAVAGVDVIFHQGALGSVARSVDDPRLTNESNVVGSLTLLDAARNASVRRVVLAGSSSVYGDTPELPKKESQRLEPVSPYAASKAAMELYAGAYSRCYEIETVTLRYFNVYGPRQDPKSQYAAVVPAFVSALLAKKPGTIHGDGQQSRDFTFVEDVCRANVLAAQAPAEKAAGRAYNIAGGLRVSMLELYEKLARLSGADEIKPVFGPSRPGDVRHTLADISLARQDLAWEPRVTLEEGLSHTVDWFRQGGK